MRKFFFGFIVITLISCGNNTNRKSVNKVPGDTEYTSMLTLTINGESHEFVKYSSGKYNNGIAHWPGCKYCKNDSIN